MVLSGFTKKFVRDVLSEDKTFEEVPEKWQTNVKDALKQLVDEDKISIDEYQKFINKSY